MKKFFQKIRRKNIQHFTFKIQNFYFVFFSLLLFFSIPSHTLASAPYSDSSKKIYTWANTVMGELYADIEQYNKEKAKECHQIIGWKNKAFLRFQLGVKDVLSLDFFSTNACLREDMYQIDAYINRVSRELSRSSITCDDKKREKYTNFAMNLLTMKSGLQAYGDLTEEEEKEAKSRLDYPDLPSKFTKDFLFSNEVYRNQAQCPEPMSFTSFHRTREEVEELGRKMDNLGEGFSAMVDFTSNFVSGKDNDEWNTFWKDTKKNAQSRGKQSADAWFSANVESQIRSFMTESGFRRIYKRNGKNDIPSDKDLKKGVREEKTTEEIVNEEKELYNIFKMSREEKENFEVAFLFQQFFSSIDLTLSEFNIALSEELEAGMRDLPGMVEGKNEKLREVRDQLRRICGEHAPCAKRM